MTDEDADNAAALVPVGPVSSVAPDFALPVQPPWTSLGAKKASFVTEYLSNGFSPGKAARKVGYSERHGSTLLKDPRVIAAIETQMAEGGLARQKILAELGLLAFSSLSDVVDWSSGKMVVRDAADLSDEIRRSVTRIKCDPETGAVIEVGMDLKGPAITTLAKVLRLTGPDLAIGVSNTVQVVLSKEDQAVL